MHVVKKIAFLLSGVAMASCGSMPVPDLAEESASPVKIADTLPPEASELTPKKKSDTSYLANVTDTQNINTASVSTQEHKKSSAGTSAPKKRENNTTNSDVQSETKSFNAILEANGPTKTKTDPKQIPQSGASAENTNTAQPKRESTTPKSKNTESDTSREVRIQLALAKRYYNSSKYQNAIDLLEASATGEKSNEKLRDLLLLTYAKYAKVLADKANLLEAQTILEKAVSIEPNNSELQDQLKKVKDTRDADRVYQLGLEAFSAGDKTKAFNSFQRVLELNPAHSLAQQQVVKIRGSIIETRYKEAMQYYRKQELTSAIQAWDDVLKMDANHELAKLYRSRAVELKRKIEAFNK